LPEKYVPKHRGAPPKHVRATAKNAVFYSGFAMIATSLSVSAGIAANGGSDDPVDGALVDLSAAGGGTTLSAADLRAREQQSLSRSSDRRAAADSLKAAALNDATGVAVTRTVDYSKADPRELARVLMPQYGLSSSQFDCLDRIWTQESNWNVHADNPYSSAYGIPQALPGSKMSSAGPDWADNPETQIRWGLGYIKNRYGTACSAWSFKASHGWY
jgi:hypothetical protein